MKTKKDMVEFLKNHFRYDTMNFCNESTSYAARVKIYDFVPSKLWDKAYELIEQGDVYDAINDELEAFAENHNHKWQIAFNGRSGGYLVLIQGGRHDNGQIYSQPGLSTDMGEDFEGWWGKSEIAERYRLVREFDEVVNECKKIFLAYCNEFEVVEEVVMVSRTVKVLKRVD